MCHQTQIDIEGRDPRLFDQDVWLQIVRVFVSEQIRTTTVSAGKLEGGGGDDRQQTGIKFDE